MVFDGGHCTQKISSIAILAYWPQETWHLSSFIYLGAQKIANSCDFRPFPEGDISSTPMLCASVGVRVRGYTAPRWLLRSFHGSNLRVQMGASVLLEAWDLTIDHEGSGRTTAVAKKQTADH